MKNHGVIKKLVRWIDPKLEKYREKKETKYTPKTLAELVEVLKRTPKNVLSAQERNMIAAVMNIGSRRASDLMILKDEMIFVEEDELLGPLNLDKLYKSGFSVFPVVDKKNKIIGVIKTDSLNSLEIKEAKSARKLMKKDQIIYISERTSIEEVIEKFLVSNCLLFIVQDSAGENIGMLTFDIVIYYLLGKI